MITTDSYWDDVTEIIRQVIWDIKSELENNNKTEITFKDYMPDDIYKVYINKDGDVCICKALSNMLYLNECSLDVVLDVAETLNRYFN